MSAALLQTLLALRQAAVQLSIDATPAQKPQLDIMATVLAKLAVDQRDQPALRAIMLENLAAALAPGANNSRSGATPDNLPRLLQELLRDERAAGKSVGANGVDIRRLAAAAQQFATASDQANLVEIGKAAVIAAAGNPQLEAFDREKFRQYLVAELGERADLEIVDVTLASRGFSKKTILVELGNRRRLPREIALRVDRAFNFLGTTVIDEFAPLVALHAAGVRLPKPHALEVTGKILDGPFIIFDRMPGALVGNNFQAPVRNPALGADVARCLAQLHRTPIATVGMIRGADRSEREQVRQELDKSYAHWLELERDIPLMEAAFNWLYAHLDWAMGARGVVHGDYNFNNILVEGDRVSAIVDWEFVQVGNPAGDLGWFYYGAQGVCGWPEFLDCYEAAGGFHFDRARLGYFVLLGQTRLAVMTLQTESGFDAGRFDDIKFGLSGALYTNKSLHRVATLLAELC